MICGCDIISGEKQKILENAFEKSIKEMETNFGVIEINIVVHICFNTCHFGFYRDEASYVIEELNKDFSGNASTITGNPYKIQKDKDIYDQYTSLSENSKIVFRLCKVKYKSIPQQHSTQLHVLNEKIKLSSPGLVPWSALNIWVVDLINIHGYAQYPWELENNSKYDGIVISRNVFGRCAHEYRFSQGKILTHLVGHWLGLFHTFEEDSLIADIPKQRFPTYGNPFTNPRNFPENDPIYMNFMDFTDDAARFIFTKDQIKKMRSGVHLYRPNLIRAIKAGVEFNDRNEQIIENVNIPTNVVRDVWECHIETADPHIWKLLPKAHKADAKISRSVGEPGLALKRNAVAEICMNLMDMEKAEIEFSVKNAKAGTCIMFNTTDGIWQRARIKNNAKDWEKKTIPLPEPLGPNYTIRFRSPGVNKYTMFDHIIVKRIE